MPLRCCRDATGRVWRGPDAGLPDAEENAVLLVAGGARLDKGVVDRDARLARLEPGCEPLLHLAADVDIGGLAAEIAEFAGVVGKVEQNGPEILPPHVLPALGAHHEGAAVLRLAAQDLAGFAEGIVE